MHCVEASPIVGTDTLGSITHYTSYGHTHTVSKFNGNSMRKIL